MDILTLVMLFVALASLAAQLGWLDFLKMPELIFVQRKQQKTPPFRDI